MCLIGSTCTALPSVVNLAVLAVLAPMAVPSTVPGSRDETCHNSFRVFRQPPGGAPTRHKSTFLDILRYDGEARRESLASLRVRMCTEAPGDRSDPRVLCHVTRHHIRGASYYYALDTRPHQR